MEKEKTEKLKESISETEEEIGVEIFVHTIEEEETKEKEIIAKIARCKRLKQEYSDKIMRLQQRSSEKNPAYDKVKANLSREIENQIEERKGLSHCRCCRRQREDQAKDHCDNQG